MELTLEELVKECQRRGLKVDKPKEEITFKVFARYDRGFGPEYITLNDVKAKNIAEADELAHGQASTYFQTEPGHENTVVNEVRIRPHE